MAALTTTSELNPNIQGQYDRRFVTRLVADNFHQGFGDERVAELNAGTKINFRLPNNLTPTTTALTEGVTPAGQKSGATLISADLAQYGDYVMHTDWLDMTGVDDKVLSMIDSQLTDQAAESFDLLCRNVIIAGTKVRYGNGSARTDVTESLEKNDVDFGLGQLERNKVRMIKEKILPGTGYNTFAVDAAYICLHHPDLKPDIMTALGTDFVKVKDYAQPGKVLPGEWGSYRNIRFVSTASAKVFADEGGNVATGKISTTGVKSDVYTLLMFGKEFYGNVRLGKKQSQVIVKQLGSEGSADPLNQRGSVGWKGVYACVIIDDTRGYRIEVACGSLADAA